MNRAALWQKQAALCFETPPKKNLGRLLSMRLPSGTGDISNNALTLRSPRQGGVSKGNGGTMKLRSSSPLRVRIRTAAAGDNREW